MALPYFPFEREPYRLTMGTRFLSPDRLIEIDAQYRAEIALKAALLDADRPTCYQAPPGTEAMAWEMVAHLLPNMARHDPDHFALAIEGERWRWTNRLLGQETVFTPGDEAGLPHPPLDWLGRQVQEDLILMDGTVEGTPLAAGHLCFSPGWTLAATLGRSFLTIHDPVAGFRERIGRPADLLMQRIKAGHPSARVNWSLAVSDHLYQSPAFRDETARLRAAITAENAGDRLFLRLERQTLSRLPATRAILFTIRTYIAPLGSELTDLDRVERFRLTIATLPEGTLRYKNIAAFREPLLAYLDDRALALAAAAD